jgi:site-specific recombinase XerD
MQAGAEMLINAPDDSTLKGKRDRALLAMLIGAGLRREELAGLTIAHLAQRDGRWCVVDIRGKRNRLRTVPIAAWVKALIDRWTQAVGVVRGRVFVALTAAGKPYPGAEDGITPQAIMRCVKK